MEFNKLFKTWDYSGLNSKDFDGFKGSLFYNKISPGMVWQNIFWNKDKQQFEIKWRSRDPNIRHFYNILKKEIDIDENNKKNYNTFFQKLCQINKVLFWVKTNNPDTIKKRRTLIDEKNFIKLIELGLFNDEKDKMLNLFEGFKNKNFNQIFETIKIESLEENERFYFSFSTLRAFSLHVNIVLKDESEEKLFKDYYGFL